MKKKILFITVMIITVGIFLYMENNYIAITRIEVDSKKLPKGFNGYRIVHLSDLHNKSFGRNQERLVGKIEKLNPDMIVITGDIIDSRRYNEKPSIELIKNISRIAPVYYVPGNHEMRSGKVLSLQKKLEAAGAIVLRNESRIVKVGTDKILVAGIDDPYLNQKKESSVVNYKINKVIGNNKNTYRILLSHRPEKFQIYVNNSIDLTFTGHAHGGQVRLPFVGGIIAPNQGWFPKYTSGKHEKGNSTMIISRGLGNSLAPLRIFNRPEIVVTTLKK